MKLKKKSIKNRFINSNLLNIKNQFSNEIKLCFLLTYINKKKRRKKSNSVGFKIPQQLPHFLVSLPLCEVDIGHLKPPTVLQLGNSDT